MIDIDRLRDYLDDANEAEPWLRSLCVANPHAAHANLVRMATSGVTLDLLAQICEQFAAAAPTLADPDMAINNLERFIAASRNPMATAALFERDPEALPNLLQIFSTSQYLSDLLVADQRSYDLLRMTEGQPVARDGAGRRTGRRSAGAQESTPTCSAALRRFKRRETLRIAYGDIVRGQPVATVARQISYLADAIVEAALDFARRHLRGAVRPAAARATASRAGSSCSRLGKLGGVELNYSSDIDLMFLYEQDGQTDARRTVTNEEFFERLAKEVIRLLTEATDLGIAYRVDMRLRPEGSRGPLCMSFDSTLSYYDVQGRTWERQAYRQGPADRRRSRPGQRVARPARAVDLPPLPEPGRHHRHQGAQAAHRAARRERRGDLRNVKTGHGGIRDIEFVIQFLQLLNGGALPEVRTGNTLDAIARLEQVRLPHAPGADHARRQLQLPAQARASACRSCSICRRTCCRDDRDELAKLAVRMGYAGTPHRSALVAFTATTTPIARR